MTCLHRTSVISFALFIVYFAWMDIQLYFIVQSTTIGSLIVLKNKSTAATEISGTNPWPSSPLTTDGNNNSSSLPTLTATSDIENICGIYNQVQSSQMQRNCPVNNNQVPINALLPLDDTKSSTAVKHGFYSPFNEFSVKYAMLDQVDNYIYSPIAELFANYTEIASNYQQITPNMISALGVIFASAAAYLVYRGKRYHRLAVLVFQLRIFCDAIDGLVARKRMGISIQYSVRSTSGFYADAIADTLGVAVFLFACWIYLRRNERRIIYVPLKSFNESIDIEAKSDSGGLRLNDHLDILRQGKNGHRKSDHHSDGDPASNCLYVRGFKALCSVICLFVKLAISSTVKLVTKVTSSRTWQLNSTVACFAMQLMTTGILWNYFIERYHLLLESPSYSVEELTKKNVVFHSSLTWTLMWFWKISCGHSLTNMLLVSVYFNKLHPFLKAIQWIGLFVLLILGFLTTLHIRHALQYICD